MNQQRALIGPSSSLLLRPLAVAVAAALAGALGGGALANPTGAQVVSGAATIVPAGPVLTVTNSPGTVINWQSFSVAAGETTRFIQPGAGSAVINRILPGGMFSPGNVQSNGQVFFINGSMLSGAGAALDFAALSLSALRQNGSAALAASLRAVARPAVGELLRSQAVATLQDGRVYVLAPYAETVRRNGGGELMVEPGRSVELADLRWPHVRVEITAPRDRALNISRLVARNGQIFSSLIARTNGEARRTENEATAIAAASFDAGPGSLQRVLFNDDGGDLLVKTPSPWTELASMATQWMPQRTDQPAAESAPALPDAAVVAAVPAPVELALAAAAPAPAAGGRPPRGRPPPPPRAARPGGGGIAAMASACGRAT